MYISYRENLAYFTKVCGRVIANRLLREIFGHVLILTCESFLNHPNIQYSLYNTVSAIDRVIHKSNQFGASYITEVTENVN